MISSKYPEGLVLGIIITLFIMYLIPVMPSEIPENMGNFVFYPIILVLVISGFQMDRLYRQLQTKNRRKLLALEYSLITFSFILWLIKAVMGEGNTSEIMLLSVFSINHFSSAFIFKDYYTYLGSLSGYSLEILIESAGGMVVTVMAGILMTSGSLIAVHVRCIETRKREYAQGKMKIIGELEKLISNR